ncbi:hypothetical protein GCM10020221_25600 [Streptomyces thioluteus]|uniref:Uncharacterized protein n=1 Tax=Streptomyces thioluteus TaxID=66431 RepID=A0ABN3WUQ5_STRTU
MQRHDTSSPTILGFRAVHTAKGRQEYVHLNNPERHHGPLVVDLEILQARTAAAPPPPGGGRSPFPPRSTVPVLLTTLPEGTSEPGVRTRGRPTLHVAARIRPVWGAAVQSNGRQAGRRLADG